MVHLITTYMFRGFENPGTILICHQFQNLLASIMKVQPGEADHCMTSRIFRRKTIDSRFPGSVLTIPSAESPNRRELQYKLGALAVYVHFTPPPALRSIHKCGIEKGTLFTPFLPSSPIKLNTPLPPSASPIAPLPDPRV